MPWQRDLLDVAYEYEGEPGKPGFRLYYDEVGIVVPRQSGKTTLELAVVVDRGVSEWGEPTISSYTTQSKKDGLIKLVDEQLFQLARSEYAEMFAYRGSHGMERLLWLNGSQFEPLAPTKDAGHGRSRDLAWADEVWVHKEHYIEQGLRPAMITKSATAQYWWSSTVGTSEPGYLNDKMELSRRAVEQGVIEGLAYFEYSAAPDEDPDNEETWLRCMPALGYTQTIEGIRALKLGMLPDEFARAFLNIPTAPRSKLAIDPLTWTRAKGQARITGRHVWAISTGPERSSASLSRAGLRDDGVAQILLMENGPGVGWVIKKLQDKGVTELVLDRMSEGYLIPELEKAGIKVHQLGTSDVINAYATLQTYLTEKRAQHAGQSLLDDAAASAGIRAVRSGAGSLFKRAGGVDISPLVAASFALWHLISEAPAKPKANTFR